MNFSIYLILPAALDSRVYSVSKINEYQKQKNNVSGEMSACVRLTNLQSVSRLSRQSPTCHNAIDLQGLLWG
jgi:hypothetical protein